MEGGEIYNGDEREAITAKARSKRKISDGKYRRVIDFAKSHQSRYTLVPESPVGVFQMSQISVERERGQ